MYLNIPWTSISSCSPILYGQEQCPQTNKERTHVVKDLMHDDGVFGGQRSMSNAVESDHETYCWLQSSFSSSQEQQLENTNSNVLTTRKIVKSKKEKLKSKLVYRLW